MNGTVVHVVVVVVIVSTIGLNRQKERYIRADLVSFIPSRLETHVWGYITWNWYREGFGGSKGVRLQFYPSNPDDNMA